MQPHFNGPDYSPVADQARLLKQHERVRDFMSDGLWRTLDEIASHTGDPPASVSAQLRHLRKPRFGSFVVEKRARGERADGLFEYKLVAGTSAGAGGFPAPAFSVRAPSKEVIRKAVEELRGVVVLLRKEKKDFSPELLQVCSWLVHKSKE